MKKTVASAFESRENRAKSLGNRNFLDNHFASLPGAMPALSPLNPLPFSITTAHFLPNQAKKRGNNLWLLPYADIMTLLLGLFIVMFAQGLPGHQSVEEIVGQKIARAFRMPAPEKVTTPETKRLSAALKSAAIPARVEKIARGHIIRFNEQILFSAGGADLTSSADATVGKLATILASTPGHIRIEGHTDNQPIQTETYPSNWELSTARATAILKRLVVTYHLPPERLSAAGFGEYHPIASNDRVETRQQNRRVDIVIETASREEAVPVQQNNLTKEGRFHGTSN